MLSHEDAQHVIGFMTRRLRWSGLSAEAAHRFAKTIYDHVERDYRKAGMLYGDSYEGMWRWLEEKDARLPAA
ncbi:MAG: hypothetical protein DIU80_012815 [Chloroflexota bacterium]|nr:MAG: hypothetical protein DIU80_19730 [Chloroflexota bacterium]